MDWERELGEGLGLSGAQSQTTKGEAEGPAPMCLGQAADLEACGWPQPGHQQAM